MKNVLRVIFISILNISLMFLIGCSESIDEQYRKALQFEDSLQTNIIKKPYEFMYEYTEVDGHTYILFHMWRYQGETYWRQMGHTKICHSGTCKCFNKGKEEEK